MNIEEKAKAYDEALEKAKAHINNKGVGDTVDLCRHLFPELRESEDERIRKEIINYLDFAESHNLLRAADYEKKKGWLAYLEKQKDAFENGRQFGIMQEQARQELEGPDEKQKEQKSTDWNKEEERVRKGLIEVVSDITGGWPFEKHRITKKEALAYLEKQKEQKPVEKYNMVVKLKEHLANTSKEQLDAEWKELEKWNHIGPTVEEYFHGIKPAEWSEEDDKMMKSVLWVLESYVSKNECGEGPALTATYPTYFKEIAWLKSLRSQSKEELVKMLQEEYNKGKKEGERIGHTRGYNKGYEDAKEECNKALSYHPQTTKLM